MSRILDDNQLFPVLIVNHFADATKFVSSWANLYIYPGYDRYQQIISKDILSESDLKELFLWKNNMVLSAKKASLFEQIAKDLDVVNKLKQSDLDQFDNHFSFLPAIWQIFLRHIIDPTQPIFDQHVYRAYAYIRLSERKELPNNKKIKLKIYYEQYIPFFMDMQEMANTNEGKEIDNALWAFGKVLKEYPKFFM